MNNKEKLLKILKELFQLNQSDLDFGIYRIMNSKSEEIQKFLENDLLSNVASAFISNDNTSLKQELESKIKSFKDDGFTEEQINNNKKVQELKEKLSSTASSSSLENDVFSHLSTFFSRYYKDGDFVSLRRYKKDTYAIPYEGEEVKLHWANSDQYYIKSGEYFRDYSFTVGKNENEKKIHFKLSNAQTESNNNKASADKERRFVILENNPCEIIDNELFINFEYKALGKIDQSKVLNIDSIEKTLQKLVDIGDTNFLQALNELAPTEKNTNRTVFEKHLKNYTSRNSFDYFIHKDLGEFLNRELDFYIKNEILFLDDIMHSSLKYEEVMKKVKIFKEIAQKLISFLAQIEELQKKLWEKKKFVIETNYCITLDKINEKHFPEILENKEQLAEWKSLFDVEISSVEDLKTEKFLVLDTKFFSVKFKYEILSVFENLDEEIDGVLINSENFGALNLLQERYKEQVKTVYIDPPYNTGNDGFLYNDSFQHSSWMSFMYDRLALGRELMSDDGVIFSSIDDREQHNLKLLNNIIFGENNFLGMFIINSSPSAIDYGHIAKSNDYALFYANDDKNTITYQLEDKDKKFKYKDEIGDFNLYPLYNGNVAFNPITRPNLFYPFYLNPNNKISPEFYEIGLEKKDGWEEVYPVISNKDAIQRVWRWGKPKSLENLNGEIVGYKNQDNEFRIVQKTRLTGKVIRSLQLDKEVSSRRGTSEIEDLFKQKKFSYPKPIELLKRFYEVGANKNSIILDYFAGSGTTGHAVINLNREDNGNRKYMLVEMGEYFDSVTKPRMQKVIYTDSWKDGKPTSKNGVSQIFKYFKLESYEDTLNNLEFNKTEEQKETLNFHPEIKEEYMLNYSLDFESKKSLLHIENFSTPFDYTLKIATSSVGETQSTNIDLIETFNYLLGLVVEKINFENGFVSITGKNLKNIKIIIIWRDNKTNEELNKFVKNIPLESFDEVYINGDNNIENANLIELKFKELMFGK
jgi:adenine-specific DNA-methyltransferase